MILEAALCITGAALVVSLYYCFKFAMIILKVQDTIESSLDILDEKYKNISVILQRPLFFDSKEVRAVLYDIEKSRDAIHEIAYSLTDNFEKEEEI